MARPIKNGFAAITAFVITLPLLVLVLSGTARAQGDDLLAPPQGSLFEGNLDPAPDQAPWMLAQVDSGKMEGHNGRRLKQEMGRRFKFDEGRRRQLEQFRMLKLLELLDLKEDQEIRFMTEFRRVRKEQEELNQKKMLLLDTLGVGLQANSLTDNDILNLIDMVQKINSRKNDLVASFLKDAREYLTAKQMGKMLLFHERFEYEMLDQVKAFRDRNRPGSEEPAPGESPDN